MTAEEIKELDRKIAVMEASKTKAIEQRMRWQGCPWNCDEYPAWDWQMYDYRVKSDEPRRVLISWPADGNPGEAVWKEVPTLDEAIKGNLAEFIEVTPEIRERLGL